MESRISSEIKTRRDEESGRNLRGRSSQNRKGKKRERRLNSQQSEKPRGAQSIDQ